MSQYDSDFQNPYAADAELTGPVGPTRTSPLAIWSLVSSLIFCCPITTILGPILGFVAIVKIKGDPSLRGTGLAIAGLIIGILATIGQIGGGLWVAGFYADMFDLLNTRAPAAVQSAFDGDAAGFRGEFIGAGASTTDAEVIAWASDLETRFGVFQDAFWNQAGQQTSPGFGSQSFPMSYQMTFADATVQAEFLITVDPSDLTFGIEQIVIFDPAGGADIIYP